MGIIDKGSERTREIRGRNSKCMRARDEWERLSLQEVSSISEVGEE